MLSLCHVVILYTTCIKEVVVFNSLSFQLENSSLEGRSPVPLTLYQLQAPCRQTALTEALIEWVDGQRMACDDCRVTSRDYK